MLIKTTLQQYYLLKLKKMLIAVDLNFFLNSSKI